MRQEEESVEESTDRGAVQFPRRLEALVCAAIVISVIATVLATVPTLSRRGLFIFHIVEWCCLTLFSVEYAYRFWLAGSGSAPRPWARRFRWVFSAWSLVDIVAIVPGFLWWFDVDLLVVRAIRLLRLLRLGTRSRALRLLLKALRASWNQLVVSLSMASVLLLVSSSLMYYLERDAQPRAFGSIPASLWWGVCTLTTVGYGDVYPLTSGGKIVASLVSLLGIGIFAIPAGVIAAHLERVLSARDKRGVCPTCGRGEEDPAASSSSESI